jgi:SAM-dependent methyltransferase
MSRIYTDGQYLNATGQSWHAEDSPWKAEQILRIMRKNGIYPRKIGEIGCGAGQVLKELSGDKYLTDCQFEGYDISPQAIKLCNQVENNKCNFFLCDLLLDESCENKKFDVLLAIDVLEHIPDYMGFCEKCRKKSEYKIYHIPLDLHVSSILRNSFTRGRYSIGHLHYFSSASALATLRDTGHEILDFFYTSGCFGVFKQHPSIKTLIANGPRWLLSKFNLPLTARIFGGYSLLVLTK